jgi:hypothetical protein
MIIITLIYGVFALYDLGSRFVPSTIYDMTIDDSIELCFDEIPASVYFYSAPVPENDNSLAMYYSYSEAQYISDWTCIGELDLNNIFKWVEADIFGQIEFPVSDSNELSFCMRFDVNGNTASLFELVFTDADGDIITPSNASDYPLLFDEQSLFPEKISFRNSMYFDEIYHARTAYEFLHGIKAYENTHPPLGKILIMLGICIFGMNPFGWRIVGTLFGIAMVPLIYIFAKRMTGHTPVSALACLLFAFDFMHFSQTRIATIDVYITFFVILMYFFMYCYADSDFYKINPRTRLPESFLPLGACGISMGLGIACKWTGIYAAAGLALIFLFLMIRQFIVYISARKAPEQMTGCISNKIIINCFPKIFIKTILFCMIFFIIIPLIIYLLSYIPFKSWDPDALFIENVVRNQIDMFNYHSTLEAEHPYSSRWYSWPIIYKPIWYYSGILDDTLREGISAFGNPLVWWLGIPAFIYIIFIAIKKKDKKAAFLIIGYLAEYLPWTLVSRITFIYHYFPSVPFVVMMIIYSLYEIRSSLDGRMLFHKEKLTIHISEKKFIWILAIYGTAAFGLFLLFYPVLSGQPIEASFVLKYLRWGKEWVLTAG